MHTGLGGRIIGLAHLTLATVDRRDVDDAAEFTTTHALYDETAHVEHRIQICADDNVPLLLGHAMKHGVTHDACIVDQHVDRPKVLRHLRNALLTSRIIADVPFVYGNARISLELLCSGVIARVIGGNPVSAIFQGNRNRVANATRASRHDGDTCHGSPPSVLFIVDR